MASPYSRSRGGGGSSYSRSRTQTSHTTQVSEPKKKRGGFLGAVSQGLSDLETAAVHAPGGVYNAGKAVVSDYKTGLRALGGDKEAARRPSQIETKILTPTLEGISQDLHHPLRHPGFTALDILTAASLGSGAAAGAARLASEGATVRSVLRPAVEPRTLRFEGETVPAGTYSRSALTRRVQKTRDRLQETHPSPRHGPQLVNRVGKEIHLNERVTAALAKAPAGQMLHEARGLKRGQRLALRVVAEGVPLQERIDHAVTNLAKAKGRDARLLRKHLKDLNLARAHIDDTGSAPRFAAAETRLAKVYETARAVAGKRQSALVDAGLLTKAGATERVSAAGRTIRGQLQEQGNLDTSLLPELFHNREGFYVTYAQTPRSVYGSRQVGNRKTIGVPKEPGSLKRFTGGALERGQVPANTPRVIAESLLESNRYLEIVNKRKALARFARDERPAGRDGQHFIPIRPVWLKNKPFPPEVREAVNRLDDERTDLGVRQRAAETLREWLHPDPDKLSAREIRAKGIKWVDQRLLYKENIPRSLVGLGQNKGVRATLAVNDSINNAERIALLYAKPAYAAPNILGNAALNLIQQGPWAVKNVTRSARLNKALGTEDTSLVDAGMGEGVSTSLLSGENTGVAAQLAHWAGSNWGKVVDTAFRRSSFLHEAAREGYKSRDAIHDLLHDPAHAEAKVRVFRAANENIIDYSRLGPFEQDIVRRVLFLYPWVKGSTRYSGRFLREHPFQADTAAHLAANAQTQAAQDFGLPVPSWFEGYFKTAPILGQKDRGPGVVYGSNPAAAALFQTPAALLETGREVTGLGPQKKAFQVPGLLSPSLAALVSAITRKDSFTGYNYPNNVSQARIGAESLYQGLPQLTLYQRLHAPYAGATSPMTSRDALLQFLLGTISPRPIDLQKLRRAGYKEQRGR